MGFPGGSVLKNLPAKQETQVWSLGWEDALEKEVANQSSILAWEIPGAEGAWQAIVNRIKKNPTRLSNYTTKTVDIRQECRLMNNLVPCWWKCELSQLFKVQVGIIN